MKHTPTLALALALGLSAATLTGCGAQPGTTVVSYDSDLSNQVTPVTRSGEYRLYKKAGLNPVLSVNLEAGEDLGFRKGDTENTLIAVYGNEEVEIQTGLLSTDPLWSYIGEE